MPTPAASLGHPTSPLPLRAPCGIPAPTHLTPCQNETAFVRAKPPCFVGGQGKWYRRWATRVGFPSTVRLSDCSLYCLESSILLFLRAWLILFPRLDGGGWSGTALPPARWTPISPNACCVYLFELLNPGISHFLLTVKPVLYDHAVYHWEKTNSPITLKSGRVCGYPDSFQIDC